MKKALRKGSNTSDDDSQMGGNGDETDTEQHDSLPRDHETTRPTLGFYRNKVNRHRNSIETQHLEGVPERKTSLKNIVKMVTQKETKKASPEDAPAAATKITQNQMKEGRKVTNKTGNEKIPRVHKIVNDGSSLSKTPSPEAPRPLQEDDEEYREKVVSERRRSILLRQKNIPTDPLTNPPTAPSDEQLNYKVVNEKNQATEKGALHRRQRSASEDASDVFQFDRTDLGEVMSDDDNTSYREMKAADVNQIKPPLVRRGSSPEYAETTKRPQRVVNAIPEEVNTKPVPAPPIFSKPKRGITSFLALVKEVVTTKKQDSPSIDPEKTEKVDETIPEEGSPFTQRTASLKRRDSISQSLRRKSKAAVKRQDSQASVWSDNIPVITISKTASDECILGDNTKETTGSNTSTVDFADDGQRSD